MGERYSQLVCQRDTIVRKRFMRSFVNNEGATHCDRSPIEDDLTAPLRSGLSIHFVSASMQNIYLFVTWLRNIAYNIAFFPLGVQYR